MTGTSSIYNAKVLKMIKGVALKKEVRGMK